MQENIEIILENTVSSVIKVIAVYISTIVYNLHWHKILIVMLVVSILTASLTHIFISKITENDGKIILSESENNILLIITFVASLLILIILSVHFNFPMAVGISLLSGLETVFWKRMLF